MEENKLCRQDRPTQFVRPKENGIVEPLFKKLEKSTIKGTKMCSFISFFHGLSQPVVGFAFASLGCAPPGTWLLSEHRLSGAPGGLSPQLKA